MLTSADKEAILHLPYVFWDKVGLMIELVEEAMISVGLITGNLIVEETQLCMEQKKYQTVS